MFSGILYNNIERIESDGRVDVKFIVLFIVFVSLARMLLEILVGSTDITILYGFSNFFTLFSFYSLALLLYTFLISFISSERPIKTARILTPFLIVSLLVPLMDYLISGYPAVYRMSSLSDFDILKISSNNPLGESIVLWLIPIMSSFYVFLKKGSIKRSVITFVAVFFAPLFLSTAVSDLIGLGRGLYYLYASTASAVLILILFYSQNCEKFGKLFMRFYERLNRVVLYVIIFIFGAATAGSIFAVSFLGIYILIMFMISFMAMCVNDYFDFLIDKTNRKNNILNFLSREELKNVVIVSFLVLMPFLVFVFESIGKFLFVYYVISIISLIFLYSYRNFIKGVFLLNYLFDALSYSFMFMAGRSLIIIQGSSELLYFIIATLIFLLIVPIKDIKDFRGDEKFGIKNLYTVFGYKKAFKITKFLLCLAFVIFSFCFVYVLSLRGLLNLAFFYFIPSAIFVPFIITMFKKKESVELSIWLIDVLLLTYLIPFFI